MNKNMKATISFNLENGEDKIALKRFTESEELADIVFQLKHNFMRKYKEMESVPTDVLLEDINDLVDYINIDELI